MRVLPEAWRGVDVDDLSPTALAKSVKGLAARVDEMAQDLENIAACAEHGHPKHIDCGSRSHGSRRSRDRHRREPDVKSWVEARRRRRTRQYVMQQVRWRLMRHRSFRIARGVALTPVRVAAMPLQSAIGLILLVAIAALALINPTVRGGVLKVIPGSTTCESATIETAAYAAGRGLGSLNREPISHAELEGYVITGVTALVDGTKRAAAQMRAGIEKKPAPAGRPIPPQIPEQASIGACCPGGLGGPQVYQASTGQQGPEVRIAAALLRAGATVSEATQLTAITKPESQWGTQLVNPTSNARGPFQIMLTSHPDTTEAEAMDLDASARKALALAREPNGVQRHWASTVDEARQYEAQAAAAVTQAAGGVVTAQPAACAPTATAAGFEGATGGSAEGFANGQIPTSALTPLSWAPGQMLRGDAAAAFEQLNVAFRDYFGRPIAVTDSYRSYAGQVACTADKGDLCAVPGTSNHGWGVALDLGGGIQVFGSPEHEWMRLNAPAFGWHHPKWAHTTKPEPWHWEYDDAQVMAAG